MKQAVMTEPGRIEIRDVPAPTPAAGEVLLRVRRIGVCGSDVHVYHGRHPYTSYPVVQGHEFAAEVVDAGESHLAPAAMVTAMPQIVCGRCPACRRGDYHICDVLKVEGFQAPGVAQELFAVPAERVIPLPAGFSLEQGALVEPAAVAVHAVARAGGVTGRNVAVMGAGPIGNLVAQAAGAAGATVLAGDLSQYRLDVAGRCGIPHVFNPGAESLATAAARAFGESGIDVGFDCAGATASINPLIESVNKGATIVVVAVFGHRPEVDLGLVQDRELTVTGTLMYRRGDYELAVEAIADGRIVTDPLVSKHFDLDDYAEAYRFIEEAGVDAMKVFIDL